MKYLLRVQDPVQLAQADFSSLGYVLFNKSVPLSRPCYGLLLRHRGRITVGTAAYTSVGAEALQNLITRIRVFGSHRRFTDFSPINMTGATAFAWPSLFRRRQSGLYVGGTFKQWAGDPVGSTGFDGTVATFDYDVWYDLPFVPLGLSKRVQVGYLAFGADWTNTLQCEAYLGDKTSLGTPAGTTTVAFSAYGGATGNPQLTLYYRPVILGALQGRVIPASIRRSYKSGNAIAAGGTEITLANLSKGNLTSRILAKIGLAPATAPSAGVAPFDSLSDTIASNLYAQVDKVKVNNPYDAVSVREVENASADVTPIEGYFLKDYIADGNPATAYESNRLSAGAVYEYDADATATANAISEVVQEEILGTPVINV